MSSKDSVSKISLSSFDDLFQTDESREDLKKEKLTEIPLVKIQNFPDHPYQVKDDESMDLLIDSIKSRGLIQPVLVRPLENGVYEMVSGHRRKRAFELIGIDKIPARVQELTRDEAILSMVDSNLQREEILPSEKAFAYKMKIDAAKRQGLRSDLTFSPVGKKLNTYEQIAEEAGDSRNQVHRFIRLTYLIKPILNLVDEKLIGMRPAVEISYLSEEQQNWLYEAIEYNDATPSHDQTLRMRKFANEGRLTKEAILDLINMEKSHCYNPFAYIHSDNDIQRLVTNLFKNTTPKGSQSNDPFWDQAASMLLKALVSFLHYEAPPEEQNFSMVLELIRAGAVSEECPDIFSPLDEIFERLEEKNPDHIALKYYHSYHSGSAKTLMSIQITLLARLEKFNLESLASMTQVDEMELDKIGEKKTAVFALIPENDTSFNFVVGMLYTQLFQQLYYQADFKNGSDFLQKKKTSISPIYLLIR